MSAPRRPERWIAAARWAAAAAGVLALTLAHAHVRALPLERASRLAPLDALFSVVLAGGMLLLAWAAGARLLPAAVLRQSRPLEALVFRVAAGLAAIAYAVLGLAFLHLLYAPLALLLAGLAAWVLRAELGDGLARCGEGLASARARLAAWQGLGPPVTAFGAALALLALAIALLPPFSYDPLLYHLEVPRRFVAAHRFVLTPDIPQGNFPFTIELLYTLALLLGSDTAPAVLHLAFGALTALAVWAFADRWLGRSAAWLALAAFLTASEVSHWAAIADIDLALTLYELLAFYAVCRWLDNRATAWLVVAGAQAGVALGAKYTAATALLPLALLVIGGDAWRRARWPAAARRALLLVGVALAVAAPWYVKNTLAFGDPLYPLLAAGPPPGTLMAAPAPAPASTAAPKVAAEPGALLLLPLKLVTTNSDQSYTGRGLADYLQLPLQVYLRGDMEQYGRPSLLFLLVPASLLLLRRPIIRRLAIVAAIEAALWAVGSQELRYLLPAFPLFALLAGAAAAGLERALDGGRLRRALGAGALALLLLLSLGENVLYVAVMNPLPVLAGVESRDAFLRHVVNVYGAYRYLEGALAPGQRALALTETRRYYADPAIITDGWGTLRTAVLLAPRTAADAAALLRREDVAYVLIDDRNLGSPDLAAAMARLRQGVLTEVYQDQGVHVYRVAGAAP